MNKNNKTPTVHELRQKGYKVKIQHYRYPKGIRVGKKTRSFLLPTNHAFLQSFGYNNFGGATNVTLILPDGRALFGKSFCNRVDSFQKKEGVRWAIMDALGLKQEDRKNE